MVNSGSPVGRSGEGVPVFRITTISRDANHVMVHGGSGTEFGPRVSSELWLRAWSRGQASSGPLPRPQLLTATCKDFFHPAGHVFRSNHQRFVGALLNMHGDRQELGWLGRKYRNR